MRLETFDIALNDGEIVRVLLARLVDSVVAGVRRLVRARLATETRLWFGLDLLLWRLLLLLLWWQLNGCRWR